MRADEADGADENGAGDVVAGTEQALRVRPRVAIATPVKLNIRRIVTQF